MPSILKRKNLSLYLLRCDHLCNLGESKARSQVELIKVITLNLKYFLQYVLDIYGVEALPPDDFIANVVVLYPFKVFNNVARFKKTKNQSCLILI